MSATSRAGISFDTASVSPGAARALLACVVLAAIAVGFLATGADVTARAVGQSGADLTRLLRAMAALKALMATGLIAAVLWRLGAVISPLWLAAYAAACGAMAAGPGVIWGMAHVGLGALLLHGGLLAAGLLLWRDSAVSTRLSAIVAARRAAIRGRAA